VPIRQFLRFEAYFANTPTERLEMNKAVLALVVAGTLVGGTTASFAATKAPVAKPTAAAEGTAKHESSENSVTQMKEAKTVKPMATKAAKPAATKAAKPMATKAAKPAATKAAK